MTPQEMINETRRALKREEAILEKVNEEGGLLATFYQAIEVDRLREVLNKRIETCERLWGYKEDSQTDINAPHSPSMPSTPN